ncbi:hypothetical protein HII13_004061 [Brettanomyces bruxellensis]|nr:hypothetical protein HII13_004061 [Brettanomyces bruxellensis]
METDIENKNKKLDESIYGVNTSGSESEEEEEETKHEEVEVDQGKRFKAKRAQSRFAESESESESENENENESEDKSGDKSKDKEEDKSEDEKDERQIEEDQDKEEYDEIEEMEKQLANEGTFGIHKMKKLTPEQLEKAQKRIKRSGVVYLSSMPPYMKPTKLRQIMERFGDVGRIFLKPEDTKSHKSRVKSGGNKKRKFDEGWCEFKSKKAAKLAAETLNGNIIGGKKRGFYHDDILNVKYLRGFKWGDLTRALNREKEVRESKMEAELARERRMNKAFIENVETSKKFNNIRRQRSKKRQREGNVPSGAKRQEVQPKPEIRRTFKQRSVVTNRAGAKESDKLASRSSNQHKKLESVLGKLF